MNRLLSIKLAAFLILIGTIPAQAVIPPACISGTATATATPGHALGDWMYCVDVTWDTGSQGLSHANVLLGLDFCPCACTDFPFGAEAIAGTSTGEDGDGACTVNYLAEFQCDDPSISGIEGPLVKFEPINGQDCEPDKSGTATFCFYSDWAPVNVGSPNTQLMVKFATNSCSGELSGQIPGCECGTTTTENQSWGGVKNLFR